MSRARGARQDIGGATMLDSLLNPVHILILLAIVVVIFGPKRLPEMGRKIGETLREINSATSDIRSQIGIDEIADSVRDVKSSLSLTGSAGTNAAERSGEQSAAGGPTAPVATGAVAAGEVPTGAAATGAVATELLTTGAAPSEQPATRAATADEAATDTVRETATTAAGRPAADGPRGGPGPSLEEFGKLPRSDAPRP
jgi:TatA/E family protein of Tat protein translocase